METSVSAGVIHRLAEQDHGLILFNKKDQWQEVMERSHQEKGMQFRYLVQMKGQCVINPKEGSDIAILAQTQERGNAWLDLQATTGNTNDLRQQLGLSGTKACFYCYQITFTQPQSDERYTVSVRRTSKNLPKITVFHAPT